MDNQWSRWEDRPEGVYNLQRINVLLAEHFLCQITEIIETGNLRRIGYEKMSQPLTCFRVYMTLGQRLSST
jgi:hypothetical protein